MSVDTELMRDVCAIVQLLDPALARRLRTTYDLPDAAPLGLTNREAETAMLAVGGMSNAQIAAQLGISVRTVETHLGNVYHKVGVNSRRQLSRRLGAV